MTDSQQSSGLWRTLFLIFFLTNCWLWMQGVHEFGHVLGALCSNGHVKCVVWHFAAISRTDVMPNPHPLLVCWAGPVTGSFLPALASALLRNSKPLRFFAGFCLIANGAYISVGSIDRVGDAGELLKLSTPGWALWLAGGIAIFTGFWIWHRMGSIGKFKQWTTPSSSVRFQAGLLAATVGLQLVLFSM